MFALNNIARFNRYTKMMKFTVSQSFTLLLYLLVAVKLELIPTDFGG